MKRAITTALRCMAHGELEGARGALANAREHADECERMILDLHVTTAAEEYTDTGDAWSTMTRVYELLTGGRSLDEDSNAMQALRDGHELVSGADAYDRANDR